MTTRGPDPSRLDVEAYARDGARLAGRWPLAGFERLLRSTLQGHDAATGDVTWSAQGERRRSPGGDEEAGLRLEATVDVVLECQRCLGPMASTLRVDRRFRFVRGEDAAARLDAEDDEHDVLALTRALDLHELAEDELLLALPLIARHESCPQPLAVAVDEADDEERPHPFAGLAALKRGPQTG